ncbi:MAG TPA: hypothetical protein VFZ25_01280 [Chloroflexota bacterium]|nr:hypothetical protein [Chloroflexota bacterium]
MMMDGSWDIAMIVWGTVWILLGTGLIYGIIRVIAAEDQAVRDAERQASLAENEPNNLVTRVETREPVKVGAA